MTTFSDAFKRASQDLVKKVNNSFRVACIRTGEDLTIQSVVGDPTRWKSGRGPRGYVGGRFRANWQTSINRIDETIVDSRNYNLSAIAQALATVHADDTVYFSNNLPYSKRLNEGHSVQKSAGWVDAIVSKFKDDFDGIVKREFSTNKNYGDGK